MMLRMMAVMASLAGFPAARRASYLALRAVIEADCDEGWHIDCMSQGCPSALNEGFAAPLAGLACDRGKACEAGCMFGIHAAQFRHVYQQNESGDFARTGDAGEDVEAALETGRGGHQLVAFAVSV